MIERLRHSTSTGEVAPPVRTEERVVEERPIGSGPPAPPSADAARARQRAAFGGISWGSAAFGFLAALGLGGILAGIAGGAGAALGLTDSATGSEEIGIGGAIALLVALSIAYYAGGYVAGRMARFDGARQGLATWLVGLLVTVALGAAAAVAGAEYNVFERLDLPRIPVDEGTLTTAGAIALAVTALATLVAAILGGKSGERFHRRVDRAAYEPGERPLAS